MTGAVSALVSFATAGALAVASVLAPGAGHHAPRTALVVDAPVARDGRALVDPRLRTIDAAVRLPRSAAEARTDLRYFAAVDEAGVGALRTPGLTSALAAVRR